jgi:tetratricopeptide (TPR) repeat protein
MKKGLFVLAMIFLAFNSYGQQSKADSIAKDEDAGRLASYLWHIMEGIQNKRDGKHKEAFVSFDSAISIDPTYPEVYYHIGKLFFETGNNLKSVENLSRAIDLGRKDFKVFLLRGMVKYNLEDYRGSDLDYLKAFEVANSLRGMGKYNLEDYRGSDSDYLKAFEVANTYEVANTQSSFFQVNDGGDDIIDNKKISDLFLKMGMNKSKLKDYNQAIIDYSKALSYDEKNSKALFFRGVIRVQFKAVSEGCLDLSRAGELGMADAYDYIKKYCN